MTDANFTNDLALFVNTPAQVGALLNRLEQEAGDISPRVDVNNIEVMGFKQEVEGRIRWPQYLIY